MKVSHPDKTRRMSVNYVTDRLNPNNPNEIFDHALEVKPYWFVGKMLHSGKNTLVVEIPAYIVEHLKL